MSTVDYIGMKRECSDCQKNHYYDNCKNCYIPQYLKEFEKQCKSESNEVVE